MNEEELIPLTEEQKKYLDWLNEQYPQIRPSDPKNPYEPSEEE